MDLNNMGLDLLINPRKMGSDSASVSSMGSINPRVEVDTVSEGSESVISIDSGDSNTGRTRTVRPQHRPASPKPMYQQRKNVEERSEMSEESEESEEFSVASMINDHRKARLSNEDTLMLKKELLYQFERLEKKGVKLPKVFTIDSNLEEMKLEFDRIKRDRDTDAGVKLQRRILMASISGIEWINGKFNPIGAKLDGWSDSIYENIDDYDDIFEELHSKYKGKSQMAPEIKLLMMLSGSAFMHHMTHSMFKTQLPGLDEILKTNPELAANLAAATSQHMNHQQKSADNLFGSLGSLGNMFGGLFGGGGGAPPPQQSVRPVQMSNMGNMSNPMPPLKPMKGPSNVEELLREIERDVDNGNDRVEMMSVISESDFTESIGLGGFGDDTSSVNGLILKKNGKRGKTLEI